MSTPAVTQGSCHYENDFFIDNLKEKLISFYQNHFKPELLGKNVDLVYHSYFMYTGYVKDEFAYL